MYQIETMPTFVQMHQIAGHCQKCMSDKENAKGKCARNALGSLDIQKDTTTFRLRQVFGNHPLWLALSNSMATCCNISLLNREGNFDALSLLL